MMNVLLLALLVVLSIPLVSSAQNTEPNYDSRPAADCSNERFEQAEHWHTAVFSDSGTREKKLGEIARQCPNEPWSSQVSEFLKAAREKSAESAFQIAKYYQDLFKSGRPAGLKGAESRYQYIVEKYPEFSKLDLTLLNLGDVELSLGNYDDAWSRYQRLINDFPTSRLVETAFKRLQRIEKIRIENPY